MTAPAITIYMTGWCPYCQRAMSLLDARHATYARINIDDQPGSRTEMVGRSGRRTVPQIFIGDKHVGGCDDLVALDASGELDRLLQGV